MKAAVAAEHRAADDAFCAQLPVHEYCRRIVARAVTEMQMRGVRDALNLDLREAQQYLDRVARAQDQTRPQQPRRNVEAAYPSAPIASSTSRPAACPIGVILSSTLHLRGFPIVHVPEAAEEYTCQQGGHVHTGQWLMVPDGGGIDVYSPWFPRGGDNAIFTQERMVEVGTPDFGVTVLHKSRDDTGDGSNATGVASWAQVGSSTFWTRRYNDLKELVRFKFSLTSSGSGQMEALLYRMLPPTWFDKTNA